MKHLLRRLLAAFVILLTSCAWSAEPDPAAPFRLTVVPSYSRDKDRRIITAAESPDEFYVVLTNISKDPQPVFETGNSWGVRTVTLEATMPDGTMVVFENGQRNWWANAANTFLIPPGEQQVYPIRLDGKWVSRPQLTSEAGSLIDITLKAIYRVEATPQSTIHKVWVGRLESKPYPLTLNRR